jgi:EmrB/QacA subfamily drug resistance transporter
LERRFGGDRGILVDETTTGYDKRWAALLVILGTEIMDLLDALVTTIAAPSIRADLDAGETLVQWLGAAYTLAMAVGLLIGGRLGDMFGRKRMFLLGTTGFTAASLLCALAQSPSMLIAARVLQGLLGAMVLPQGLGMIKEMFPPAETAKAFGAFGPIMGLSAVGGPILGGWLVDVDLFGAGWRAIFAINVPIGVVTVLAALRFLPKGRRAEGMRLDLLGAALGAVGAGLVIYPLVQGREVGWPAWTFTMMGASVLTFAWFAGHEQRTAAAGRTPLIEPSLFTKPAFSGGIVVALAIFSAMIGSALVTTLWMQVGLGWSPTKAAVATAPSALGMVVGFIAAGAGLAEQLGRRLMHAGLALMAAGMVLLLIVVQTLDSVGPWPLAPALLLSGVGTGLTMAPMFDIVLAGVSAREVGSAGGVLTAVQQLGGAVGIAVLGTVFFSAGPAQGFGDLDHAFALALGVEIALVALAFGLTYLLPRRARAEGGAHGAPALTAEGVTPVPAAA